MSIYTRETQYINLLSQRPYKVSELSEKEADLAAAEAVLEVVRKSAKHLTVKSRNMTKESLDLIIELRTDSGSALIRDMLDIACVTSASLMAHDGEVTF